MYSHKKVNKIAPSSNEDKKLQTSYGITSYSQHINAEKVFETELLQNLEIKI